MKVGSRYKAIYCRRQILKVKGEKQIQAFHIELDMNNFKSNFNNLVIIYNRKVSGFEDGRKMRFFPHPDFIKSDSMRGALSKAYKRQKFFQEMVL